MPPKRLTSTQRLKVLLKEPLPLKLDQWSLEKLERGAREHVANLPELTREIREKTKELEIDSFSTLAPTALSRKLLPEPYEDAITVAFKSFSLDRKNPFHWRILVGLLAYSHFGDPRRRGREKRWTTERYCLLLEDVDRLKSRNSTLSDRRACHLLKEGQFKERYKNQSGDRLADILQEARDPWKNEALLAYPLVQLVNAHAEASKQAGKEMSEEEKVKCALDIGRFYADAIGRRWREKQPESAPG